jgi:hypothetical protein
MIEIRFDKTKDEVALLIWFLVDHSVCVANIVSTKLPLQRLVITKMLLGYKKLPRFQRLLR